MTKRTTPPQVDDADVDAFIAQWIRQLNPAIAEDKRADMIEVFVVNLLAATDQGRSTEWNKEFARRVRSKVLWMKSRGLDAE